MLRARGPALRAACLAREVLRYAAVSRRIVHLQPEDTSRKIELAVGQDLQFIRINGTIMGALVGLILYLIGLAL